MTRERKFRLAVVASHVIQYQDPLFTLLAQHPEVDLTVLYCSSSGATTFRDRDMGSSVKWDIATLQDYKYKFLQNFSPLSLQHGFFSLINPGIASELLTGRYDAVIIMLGWGSVSAWISFAASSLASLPFFLYGDSSFLPPEGTARARLRAKLLRRLFAIASGFMISGKSNAAYYQYYGADKTRFFPMPWAVDNDRFSKSGTLSPEQRNVVRDHFKISHDHVVILFSAKLVERKDPATLLEAVGRMQHREKVTVVFAGDGVLRQTLQAQAARLNVKAIFPGFINQTALPEIYGMSDVFVLPSTFEQRGTVVNEAMACGLPVVVSSRVGPASDIAQHDVNGFVFEVGEVAELAGYLDRLTADPELRNSMGRKSREIIGSWDYRADVDGILKMLHWIDSRRAAARESQE